MSGELTTAERKFRDPFDFRPFATCWFGTNHMPHTLDFSDALFRRAIILPFNRKFEEHEQDKTLKDKLLGELPGILNLSLLAIADVIKRGHFTEVPEVEAAKAKWRMEADQVATFVDEECSAFADAYIAVKELYVAYMDWATEGGIKRRVNKNTFVSRLERLGYPRKRGTGGVRQVSGIMLHPSSQNRQGGRPWTM